MCLSCCCYCLDGIPDVVTNVEVKTISQTQVKVYWNPPANANSDPSLLQYRVRLVSAHTHAHTHARMHTQHTHADTYAHTRVQTERGAITMFFNDNLFFPL